MKKILFSIVLSLITIISFGQVTGSTSNWYNSYKFKNGDPFSVVRTSIWSAYDLTEKIFQDSIFAIYNPLFDTAAAHISSINALRSDVTTLQSEVQTLEDTITDKPTIIGTPVANNLSSWNSATGIKAETELNTVADTFLINKHSKLLGINSLRFGNKVSTQYQPGIYRLANSLRLVDSSSYARGHIYGYKLDSLFGGGSGTGTGTVDIYGTMAVNQVPYMWDATNIRGSSNFVYESNTLRITNPTISDTVVFLTVPESGVGLRSYLTSPGSSGIAITNAGGSYGGTFTNASGTGALYTSTTGSGFGIYSVTTATQPAISALTTSTGSAIYGYTSTAGHSFQALAIGAGDAYKATLSSAATGNGLDIANAGNNVSMQIASTGTGGGVTVSIGASSTYSALDITNFSSQRTIQITNGSGDAIAIYTPSYSSLFRVNNDSIYHYQATSFQDYTVFRDSLYLKKYNPKRHYGWLYMDSVRKVVNVDSSDVAASKALIIELPRFRQWFKDRKDGELRYYNPNTDNWEYGYIHQKPQEQVTTAFSGIEMLARYINNLHIFIGIMISVILIMLAVIVYLFIRVKHISK